MHQVLNVIRVIHIEQFFSRPLYVLYNLPIQRTITKNFRCSMCPEKSCTDIQYQSTCKGSNNCH